MIVPKLTEVNHGRATVIMSNSERTLRENKKIRTMQFFCCQNAIYEKTYTAIIINHSIGATNIHSNAKTNYLTLLCACQTLLHLS